MSGLEKKAGITTRTGEGEKFRKKLIAAMRLVTQDNRQRGLSEADFRDCLETIYKVSRMHILSIGVAEVTIGLSTHLKADLDEKAFELIKAGVVTLMGDDTSVNYYVK